MKDLIEVAREDLSQDGRIRAVSEATGIPYTTLWNIRAGATTSPRYATYKALDAYYRLRQAEDTLKTLQSEQQQAGSGKRRQME